MAPNVIPRRDLYVRAKLTNCCCKVTDDITLEIQPRELIVTLRPPRSTFRTLGRTSKTIKAKMVGKHNEKGGVRLDKYRISPDDMDNFEEYANIQLCFKDLSCKSHQKRIILQA
jgi:hypothetical protein